MFKNMDGNIPGGNFLGWNFPGGNFPGGSLMGRNFPGGSFPWYCLHAFKRGCWFFNNALHTFKMWLNKYFLNSWHQNCETVLGKNPPRNPPADPKPNSSPTYDPSRRTFFGGNFFLTPCETSLKMYYKGSMFL